MTAPATRALAIVRRAGVAHHVHAYEAPDRHGRDRDRRPSYGLEASASLGVAPGRMFKTLVAAVDDRTVLALVPVAGELDLKRLAAACEGRRAQLATTSDAERATGQVIGGISPLGTRRPLPVIIDMSARAQPTVLVSAGRRGLQLEIAPDDLVRLCSGRWAAIARDQGPG